MSGIKSLRRIQLGLEATKGNAVAATALWRGTGTLEDRSKVVFPPEDIGYGSGVDRSYLPELGAALAMEETPATFEQLGYVLAAGIKDVVSGAADGAGTSKIYTYTFPTTAAPTTKAYTLEGGDDQQEEEAEYCFVTDFKLSGKGGGEFTSWMLSANWLGRQITVSTFTGAIAVPTVEEIQFGPTKLYIDAVGGTIGTTLKSNTLIGFELPVRTGLQPRFEGDGNKYFSRSQWAGSQMEVLLRITFEHDGTAVAEKAARVAQTPRLIRLQSQGSAVATPGTAYTYKTARIDLAGKWESFEKIGEENGNDVVTGVLRARYNATSSKFAEILIVNELATLP